MLGKEHFGHFFLTYEKISDDSFTPSFAIYAGNTEPMHQTHTVLKVCSVLSTAAVSLHFKMSTAKVIMPGNPMAHKGYIGSFGLM